MSTRDAVLRAGTLSAAAPGPILWALVAFAGLDPFLASYIMVIGVCLGFVMVLTAPWLDVGARDGSRQARLTDMLVIWTIASTCAQLGWELPFALGHRLLVGVTERDTWAWLWWAYGVADTRYLVADPFVVVMEGFTAMVGGPLEIWIVSLAWRGQLKKAALWGLVIAATQWYGTVLYFGIEAFGGFSHINTAVFIDWGLKFVFLNALWLVMPLVEAAACMAVLTGAVVVQGGSPARMGG